MNRVLLVLTLLGACTVGPPSLEQLVDGLELHHPAERECLLSSCRDATDPHELGLCRIEQCAAEPETWVLKPTSIRHEGETFFVQASLEYTPGSFGGVPAPRPREAYVGVTVVPSDGDEIDLAVTTVFADKLDEPFTLSTDVGPDVRDVIFGVWDRKIEPCDSERSGCKEFGFVLDGPLATWPPTVYVDGTRQRVPPAALDVLVLDAGAGPDLVERRQSVLDVLQAKLSVFGSSVGRVTTRRASRSVPGSHIAVADNHDLLLAKRASKALDHDVSAVVEPQAAAPVVLRLGGPHFDLVEPCAELTDEAYEACLAEQR